MTLAIRSIRAGDEVLVVKLLYELAEYEKITDRFHITEDIIRRDYLGERPLCNADLAFEGEAPVGVMSWYWIYGTFAAARGIWLEDLFVRPAFRGKGHGKALLAFLAKRAVDAGANRVEWSVLDWNRPSIDFYESLGARPPEGWLVYRLNGDALMKLGQA